MMARARKKINWLNHILEFLVVLSGIMIAFQLNKCSDNREKRDLIVNHLAQIRLECQSNEEKLLAAKSKIEDDLKICDSLLLKISKSSNPKEIRDLATALLDLRNVEITTHAYTVLVESGDIRYLKNFETKRGIISMYEQLEKVDDINRSNKNLYDTHFYPYIKSNFDLVNWQRIHINSEAEAEKYYSKEFANIISTYRFLLVAKQRIYQEQRDIINEYLNH